MRKSPGANLTEFRTCFTTQELSGHAFEAGPVGYGWLEDGFYQETTRKHANGHAERRWLASTAHGDAAVRCPSGEPQLDLPTDDGVLRRTAADRPSRTEIPPLRSGAGFP